MKNKILAYVVAFITGGVGLAGALVGCFGEQPPGGLIPENLSRGVAIAPESLPALQAELSKTITSAPARTMKQSGLAGAMGGAHVRLTSGDPQEILLPMPQLVDGQAPLSFAISSVPPEAVTEFRLCKREDCNVVVSIRLTGKNQDVLIAWSSVVLLASQNISPNATPPDAYCSATACVQSQDDEVVKLAAQTWPGTGKAIDFAANIQRHLREMKRREQPRSLDALGILHSGEGGICTANANLAAALMRSKGLACRSIAVIPPISQRLEMHRIVEFFKDERWIRFDPSSLQTDIPVRPWQNIIMAKTTAWDEQAAMKPRMGSMVGCPYGQELELLSSGVNLAGQDFFWTMAKPLAEFDVTEESFALAAEAWTRYLWKGTLTAGQLKAASAKTATELVESLRGT